MWVWFLVFAVILLIAFGFGLWYAGSSAVWVWLLLALSVILFILALVTWWYVPKAVVVAPSVPVVAPAGSLPASTPVVVNSVVPPSTSYTLPASPRYRSISSLNTAI